MLTFSDARLKIKRADEHICNVEERIAALHETDTSRVEIHLQFGTERLIHEFADTKAFDDLALMIGDVLHNLNCALDYTWFQTVKRMVPAVIGDRTKFPVRETVEELEGWLKSPGRKHPAIHDLCPNLSRFLLDEIRPYRAGNHAIWPVHILDNIDKHRLLIPILSSGDISGIVVVDENGESWHGNAIGTIQEPPYVVELKAGLHFKEKGKLTAWILVKNPKLLYPLRIHPTLVHYSDLILKVVESFEALLESEGFED
jgi:hypothetical protein